MISILLALIALFQPLALAEIEVAPQPHASSCAARTVYIPDFA